MAANIAQGGINLPVINVSMVVTVAGNGHAANAVKANDPVLAGNIPGVAETDYNVNGDTLTDINTSCIARLSVVGKTAGGGNAAINAGDLLYMQTDGTIDKNSSGTGAIKYGTAFGNDDSASAVGLDTRTGQLVASGATTVIRVWVGKIN